MKAEQAQGVQAFTSNQNFVDAQRMAQALAASSLVPEQYRGNVANTLIALEMAQRTGSSPMAVMQNLNIIHGKPSWSSSFIIAALGSCGRFEQIQYQMENRGPKNVRNQQIHDVACRIVTKSKPSGDVLEGPWVSIEMAVLEGWYTKSGSKWQTMPELMLRYRAAAFFGRLYAADVLMGMHSDDEVRDFTQPAGTVTVVANNAVQQLNARLTAAPVQNPPAMANPQAGNFQPPPPQYPAGAEGEIL